MEDALSSISLRRLRTFLKVCETLHMGRAAEQLDITQPALSQQIQSLETALGTRLFNRRKRSIDLTAAGDACRLEAERLLAAHASMIAVVHRTARGDLGRIDIGYVGSLMYGERFPNQLKQMQARFPDVEVALRQGTFNELITAVRSGDLDVAIIGAPAAIPEPLGHRPHSRQELVVALSSHSPLAEMEVVPLGRLAEVPTISLIGTGSVGATRIVTQAAATQGVVLTPQWQVSEYNGVLGLVAAGLGSGVVPRDLARVTNPDIVFRPLAPAGLFTEYWTVWNTQRVTPPLGGFMDIATNDPTSRTYEAPAVRRAQGD